MIMNIMFNRISKFQIRCSVDGNFANYNARCGRLEIAPTNNKYGISQIITQDPTKNKPNLCLIGFRNFRYAALLMVISRIIAQDAGD